MHDLEIKSSLNWRSIYNQFTPLFRDDSFYNSNRDNSTALNIKNTEVAIAILGRNEKYSRAKAKAENDIYDMRNG